MITEGGWTLEKIVNVFVLLGILCGGTYAWAVNQEKIAQHEKEFAKQEELNLKFESLFIAHDDRMDLDDLEDKLEEKDIKRMADDMSAIKVMFEKWVATQVEGE